RFMRNRINRMKTYSGYFKYSKGMCSSRLSIVSPKHCTGWIRGNGVEENQKLNVSLRIMKMMFQMGYAIKIGKMYYISLESQAEFLEKMKGKEVFMV
ncbi:MAG: hypothetical protein PUF65_04000, partial [Lachnospiraceae bacterium]|nr:hypothetical protein [Lachnospiraceae bacterium]